MTLDDTVRERLLHYAMVIREAKTSMNYAPPERQDFWQAQIDDAVSRIALLPSAEVQKPFGHSINGKEAQSQP